MKLLIENLLTSVIIITMLHSCPAQKTILAVFAHPDDETTISPILAEYSSSGSDVYVVIATDGRYGVTDHAQIPVGDSLVETRQNEIRCSCKALGIEEPILLDAHDGMKGIEGVDAQFSQFSYLTSEINKIIDSLAPNVIITMGPEGDSGHPDHRIVSAIVTQQYFSKEWISKPDLYYCGWSLRQAKKYDGWNLYHIHEKFINTKISYSLASEQKHFNAIQCYKSQYSEETIDWWINLDRADPIKELYLRRVLTGGSMKTSF